ncbi:MAG: lysostaphin resistance A-like protein [Kiritimatiellia bacterium]
MRKPIHSLLGGAEIIAFLALYQGLQWSVGIRVESTQWAAPMVWVMALAGALYYFWYSPVHLHGDTSFERGFIWGGHSGTEPGVWRNAYRPYAGFTLVGVIVLIIWAWQRDPNFIVNTNWKSFGIRLPGYVVSAFAQAMFFYGFILTRLRHMIPDSAGSGAAWRHRLSVALVATICFAAFHLPNPLLMAVTAIAGFFWAWIFYRYPNLLLLALSHAVLGNLLHRVVQVHMRTGPFYGQPDRHVIRHIIPGLRGIIGDMF